MVFFYIFSTLYIFSCSLVCCGMHSGCGNEILWLYKKVVGVFLYILCQSISKLRLNGEKKLETCIQAMMVPATTTKENGYYFHILFSLVLQDILFIYFLSICVNKCSAMEIDCVRRCLIHGWTIASVLIFTIIAIK